MSARYSQGTLEARSHGPTYLRRSSPGCSIVCSIWLKRTFWHNFIAMGASTGTRILKMSVPSVDVRCRENEANYRPWSEVDPVSSSSLMYFSVLASPFEGRHRAHPCRGPRWTQRNPLELPLKPLHSLYFSVAWNYDNYNCCGLINRRRTSSPVD